MSETIMNMATPIRKVEGKVGINFFTGRNSEITIETSREDDFFERYQKQIITDGLEVKYKYACLDERTTPDGSFHPLGKNDHIGWWGDLLGGAGGNFTNPQFVQINFLLANTIPFITVRGDIPYGEYPLEFMLTYYNDADQETPPTKQPVKTITVVNINDEVTYNGVPQTNVFSKAKCEYRFVEEVSDVTAVKISITKWSAPETFAKISFFSDERIEEFEGDKLKSIEVLEEKTSNADKLSYDISSNYCQIKFLNEDYKYFEPGYYNRLRKNREIKPNIYCGVETDPTKKQFAPLGTFYSDEWSVPSDSQFVTVKAYDILYSLKDVIINYGMIENVNALDKERIDSYKLYSGQMMTAVIARVEKLINAEREKSGIWGSNIGIIPKIKDFPLDYTLIEEKTAWEVLQDIANLCCAYVYVDRAGNIVIEQDDFDGAPKTMATTGGEPVKIDMENAFSYSLPVSSKNVVNRIDVEYYSLEQDDKPDDDNAYEIKQKDYIIKNGIAYFTVKLKKIYGEIDSIVDSSSEYMICIEKANYDLFYCFIKTDEVFSKDKLPKDITIVISSEITWKLESRNYMDSDQDSIVKNGLKELKCGAGATMTKKLAEDNAENILKKYASGISFLISDWRGDYTLEVGMTFKGDGEDNAVEEKNKRKTFECLSNEMVLDGGFKAKTKGIEQKT
ncbi:MAG: hypothetical protein FWD58_03120 [Firmicutes bacterium]|nr:hypothetical protein [Bacillota bacterium]